MPKSNCCSAELKIEGGDEGTYFYRCLGCGRPADQVGEVRKVADPKKLRLVHKDKPASEKPKKGKKMITVNLWIHDDKDDVEIEDGGGQFESMQEVVDYLKSVIQSIKKEEGSA